MLTSLLSAGPQKIAVYGDGSFSHVLLTGAWAAYVPVWGIQLAGVGPGPSSEFFELCALLEGVRAVLAIDYTDRPLHLYSDSEFALEVFQRLSARGGLPGKKRFDSVRGIYAGAIDLVGARRLCVRRSKSTSPFHQICHRSAHATLCAQVRLLLADSAIRRKYEDDRRKESLRELERLQRRRKKLENELMACHARIEHLSALQAEIAQRSSINLPGNTALLPR